MLFFGFFTASHDNETFQQRIRAKIYDFGDKGHACDKESDDGDNDDDNSDSLMTIMIRQHRDTMTIPKTSDKALKYFFC